MLMPDPVFPGTPVDEYGRLVADRRLTALLPPDPRPTERPR